jgi:hypothetical protein
MKLAPLLLTILALAVTSPAQAARSSAPLHRNIICSTSPDAPPARLTITRTRFIVSRGLGTRPLEFNAPFVRLKHSIAFTYFTYHEYLDGPPSSSYVTYMFSRLGRHGSRMTQARYDGRMVVSASSVADSSIQASHSLQG